MCGIGGILRVWPAGTTPPLPHESIPEAWLDAIDESIKHRGPDGQGRFRDRAVRPDGSVVDVALVHRRLAIIDPACGQQPMVSERGRSEREPLVAVVFNGCIYNHRELRRELERAGHRFVTDHSDTEVLVHGWREWGLGTVVHQDTGIRDGGLCSKLEGMFAAAVWDRGAGSLTLMRDQCGEKPLYCTPTDEGTATWAFASTAAPVVALPGNGLRSGASIRRWLHLGFDEMDPCSHPPSSTLTLPETLSVHSWGASQYMPKGSRVEDWGELSEARYDRDTPLSEDRAEELIRAAVVRRLEADVPLGCFLSGGIDSGLIASIARQELGRLQTFTMRMPDPRYDESAVAARTAAHLGTTHQTLECDPHPADDVVRLITQLGLPFGDSSLLPTYWLSRAARRHVRVVLTGDGGDELFGGYERQMVAPLLSRASWGLRLLPASLIDRPDPTSRRAKLARLVRAARGAGYEDLAAIFPTAMLRRLTGRGEISGSAGPWLKLWLSRDASIEAAMEWDLERYLPEDLMRKADTATMSVALEARAPFLDRDLYAAARSATIPSLLPGGRRKGLVRAVARRHLPGEVVDRPKQGFAVPIGEWFRTDYGGMRQLLSDHLSSAEPWPGIAIELNRRFVAQMLDEHMKRRRDHGQRLYMLLVLSIWARSLRTR